LPDPVYPYAKMVEL